MNKNSYLPSSERNPKDQSKPSAFGKSVLTLANLSTNFRTPNSSQKQNIPTVKVQGSRDNPLLGFKLKNGEISTKSFSKPKSKDDILNQNNGKQGFQGLETKQSADTQENSTNKRLQQIQSPISSDKFKELYENSKKPGTWKENKEDSNSNFSQKVYNEQSTACGIEDSRSKSITANFKSDIEKNKTPQGSHRQGMIVIKKNSKQTFIVYHKPSNSPKSQCSTVSKQDKEEANASIDPANIKLTKSNSFERIQESPDSHSCTLADESQISQVTGKHLSREFLKENSSNINDSLMY